MNMSFANPLTVLVGGLLSAVLTGCFPLEDLTANGDNDVPYGGGPATLYFVVPGADFHAGAPPAVTVGDASAPTVTNATATPSYQVDTPVAWAVTWEAEVSFELTDVIIEMPELGGYFLYQLSPDEIAYQSATIETYVTWERPDTTAVCNRDYRGNGTCYEAAAVGETYGGTSSWKIDFSVTRLMTVEGQIEAEWSFLSLPSTPEVIEVPSENPDILGPDDGSGGSGQVCTISSTDFSGMTCGGEYCAGVTSCCDACSISACISSNSDCSSISEPYYRVSDLSGTYSMESACELAAHCTSVCYGTPVTCQ